MKYTKPWRQSSQPQPEWMLGLRVGDVLRNRAGDFRVVREVSRYATGELACVTFAIRRCSWTWQCYTVMNYTDLKHGGYYPAGIRVRLNKPIDEQIARCIRHDRCLTCCDVQGVG